MGLKSSVHVVQVPGGRGEVEIVERKGLGHPDTICDAIAEDFSRTLSRYYLENFGVVLHHNVDKALLCGGRSRAEFGSGEVLEPIDLYLAGRATTDVGGRRVPVEELAIECARRWFSEHLSEVDVEQHLRIHCVVREGSADLTELFGRGPSRRTIFANDTSLGVGYAPLSAFEQLVLDIERELNSEGFRKDHPAGGADVKVMGLRRGEESNITIARAFKALPIADLNSYVSAKDTVESAARALAEQRGFAPEVSVNVADDPNAGSVYLTLTGTSAEAGDDGEVGRGNRVNGLITPHRPMSLEAAAGKNPVNHVGKLYNVAAREIAEHVVETQPVVKQAVCTLLSAIGKPVDEPQLARVELTMFDGATAEVPQVEVEQLVGDYLTNLDALTQRLIEGRVSLF
jgi:S-adenosylmethionine synthetase